MFSLLSVISTIIKHVGENVRSPCLRVIPVAPIALTCTAEPEQIASANCLSRSENKHYENQFKCVSHLSLIYSSNLYNKYGVGTK